jgi:2,4-dienoyl-CoA reductase-like NADH-dependent reductase (Old Yellow Enzyme family)
MPKELSQEEIQRLSMLFGEAARRVKETGADGVEVHMAHGYLLNQFLSLSNQRTDEYGGDPERRMRMALEVLRTVRNRVGSDFGPLPLSADEYVEED